MSENGTVQESRICVSFEDHLLNFSTKEQSISLLDAREVLRRISAFIRNYESGISQSKNIVDDFKFFPEEEEKKVCIVWDPATRKIRFSVSGMDGWEAALLCDNAATMYDTILINAENVSSGE